MALSVPKTGPTAMMPQMRACAHAGKIYGDRNGWRAFHVERSMRGDERSNLALFYCIRGPEDY
jgi:hypothetical protein